jgi:hypothetical protein
VSVVGPVKALEFQAQLTPERTLQLPPDVAAQIPAGRPVRVLVFLDDRDGEAAEEAAWKQYALEKLFEGEEELDGLYDRP